jgi:hypothetical protein
MQQIRQATRLHAWRYVDATSRDLRLDFLRGWALVAMFINHVGGASWLYVVSGREVFYTSAAEPFYFLSGAVLGMVSARRTLAEAVRRVLRRTWTIYLAAIGIALSFAAIGFRTDLQLWHNLQYELPWGAEVPPFLVGILTLHESFHGGQVLVLYVVFMLATPLALLACAEGKTWLVVLVSGLIYYASQRYPDAVSMPVATYPPPAAWQPIFFGGFVLGYHRARLSLLVRRTPAMIRAALLAGVLLAAGYFLWVHAGDYAALPGLPEALGDRELEMRPTRLTLVALYLLTCYVLVTLFWTPLSRLFGWLLIPLGQASLWSFTMHLVALLVLWNLPVYDFYDAYAGKLTGTLWQLAMILSVWATVMLRQRMRLFLPRHLTPRPAGGWS